LIYESIDVINQSINASLHRGLLADENLGARRLGDEALRLPAGHSKRVLWNNYIAAVNGALRHVAAQEALPMLDYEGMMLQLPTAHAHSRDGFHPQARKKGRTC